MGLSKTWIDLFLGNDLARGESYFLNGRVRGLTATSNGWTAKVYGSTTYATFVPGDEAEIEDMSCDCPRFENGYYCKHLAATCMAIEEKGDSIEVAADTKASNIDELVKTVAEKDVRAFLAEVLMRDELLATEFVQRFGAVDARAACRKMAQQIQDAVWEYADRGFIDWRGALGFERRYGEVVHTCIDPMVERGVYDAALELSIQALRSLQPIEIDDSDGFFSGAIDDVERMWEAWLAHGDDAFAHRLFDAITDYLQHEPRDEQEREIYSYGADMASNFQIEHFVDKPSFAEGFVALADERIETAARELEEAERELKRIREAATSAGVPKGRRMARQTTNPWQLQREESRWGFHIQSAQNALDYWTIVRLRALRATGASLEDLLGEAGATAQHERVCLFLVDYAMQNGSDELALQLLLDCKEYESARRDGFYPPAVSQRIVDLCEERDAEAMRTELVYMLAHATRADVRRSVTSLWTQLRGSYGEDEWLRKRDSLLEGLADPSVRMGCLKEEGLCDRLMDEVESAGLGTLCRFEDVLVEHYADRVLAMYLNSLENYRTNPGEGRGAYQQLAVRLRHVKGIPGGKEPVQRLVQELCANFPRRRALLDELSRV